MNTAAVTEGAGAERLASVVRGVVGVLAGGLAGGVAWMVIAHQGEKRGWTDQDFPQALGELRGAELTDVPRAGLWAGLAIGIALAVLLPVAYRSLRGAWFVKALPLVLVPFLAWGLWFSPRVADQTSFPGGLFGLDAGWGTFLTYALAALGYGIVAGRVYSVCADREFWQPKANNLREQGAEILSDLGLSESGEPPRTGGQASLELPEQGLKKPGEPSGH